MGEWRLTPDKLKRYPHFDAPLSIAEATALATNPVRVSRHAFYPLLLFKEEWWPFRRGPKEQREKKSRKIRYAARGDAYIFSYYRHLLSEHYERQLRDRGISDNVIAYRRIPVRTGSQGGKCNIHFAAEAFDAITRIGSCCAVTLDISKYFESIDHARLKRVWCDLLELDHLPNDHWAVFKAITRYSEVDRDLAYERLGFAQRRRDGGFTYLKSKGDIPPRLCTPFDFRTKIGGDNTLIKRNKDDHGIPQGAPLSDLLANAYLLEFDTAMARYARQREGLYLRYSDDILLVLPGDGRTGAGARAFAANRIKAAGTQLVIKRSKASTVVFRADTGKVSHKCVFGRGLNGLEYLGFRFDGEQVFFRDSTLGHLNRKIVRAVRAEVRALLRRYPGKDQAFIASRFDANRLMQRFGRKEDFDVSDGPSSWTFWTYAHRAASIFGPRGSCIFGQIKQQRALVDRCAQKVLQAAYGKGGAPATPKKVLSNHDNQSNAEVG